MTEFIFAHPSPYDVSITLAIFDNWEQVTRRTFPLRNLTGQTEDEQVEAAAAIMAGVASELHYMTGYGIDRGTVKLNSKKAYDIIYTDHAPLSGARYFWYGVKFSFTKTLNYQWVNGRYPSASSCGCTTTTIFIAPSADNIHSQLTTSYSRLRT